MSRPGRGSVHVLSVIELKILAQIGLCETRSMRSEDYRIAAHWSLVAKRHLNGLLGFCQILLAHRCVALNLLPKRFFNRLSR